MLNVSLLYCFVLWSQIIKVTWLFRSICVTLFGSNGAIYFSLFRSNQGADGFMVLHLINGTAYKNGQSPHKALLVLL